MPAMVERQERGLECNSVVWLFLFAGIVALLAAHFYLGIQRPWVENDNYYGAIYSQAAHNNSRAGLRVTAGVPATLYFGELPIPPDAYYVHHPTLLPLLVTASFALFGETEWAARLVPIFCSLLSLVILWLLARDILDRRFATFAAAIFSFLPMELHYGDMVDFEPCLLMLMLASLLFIRYWLARNWKPGMWLAGMSCISAFWMDWPGYLFVLSVTIWLLLTGKRRGRIFAIAILFAGFVSGTIFLVQIRHANPAAWSDLWIALKMRLGNGTATGSSSAEMQRSIHFTMWQWLRVVLTGIREDYLPLPWILCIGGAIRLVRLQKKSTNLRWIGWAIIHMAVAGILYVTVLRNESFIHDFTTFYLMGSVALLGALGVESLMALCAAIASPKWIPASRIIVVALLFSLLASTGYPQAERMRSIFCVLSDRSDEPAALVPDLGRRLALEFRPGTTVLCNFDPYYSVLPYYAERVLVNNLLTPGEWKDAAAEENGPLGGIIWSGRAGASELAGSLRTVDLTPLRLDGYDFLIWRPRVRDGASGSTKLRN